VPCPGDYEYRVEIADRFKLYECGSCDSAFIWPRPNDEELHAMYPDDYYAYAQEPGPVSSALYRWRCRREAKRFLGMTSRRPVKIFDVGAGDCRHFFSIAPLGSFRFYGVEMNGAMAQRARDAGFDVVHSTFEDFDPAPYAGQMDIVTMNHVVEHVIDPEETLLKARELLVDGGVFYGRTPKLDGIDRRLFGRYWGGYHFPRHLHIFSSESLRDLLLRCGFRKVEIREDLGRFQALSMQNAIAGGTRLPVVPRHGITSLMPALVVLTAPGSYLEYLLRRGDCMTFEAHK
jgi:SAM-dependent methyltransferase